MKRVSRAYKPTLKQKKLIASKGLDARDWLVLEETESELRLVHKRSGSSRRIKKSPTGAATLGGRVRK